MLSTVNLVAERVPLWDEDLEIFKKEVRLWRMVTRVEKGKQGIALVLGLPKEVRTRVLEQLSEDAIAASDGMETVMKIL